MTQYKIQKDGSGRDCAVTIIGQNISIPLAPDNADYQQFKKDVLAGETLERPDGTPMTQAEADAYIATLP